MTQVGPAPTAPSTVATPVAPAGYLEWGPIVAGALLAAALSFVLLTFGAAIGLSATSPWPNSGVSAKFIAGVAVFWTLVQQIGAFMAGGYIAGRMRTRWNDVPQDEVDFRDGLHGGLVWAVGIVIGAALLLATAGAVARTGAQVAGQAAVTVTGSNVNAMDTVMDTLLRPSAPPPAPAGQQARAGQPAAAEAPRATVGRILAASLAEGGLSTDNRTYLVQLVSQQTGLSQQEVETRVNNAVTATREAADKARRTAVTTGLVTAVSLVISFAAAWWAALKGGQHRDNQVPARFEFAQRRSFTMPRTTR
jgi:hypothetical protein